MNGQLSFSDMEYSLRKRQGKKEAFLNRMEEITNSNVIKTSVPKERDTSYDYPVG